MKKKKKEEKFWSGVRAAECISKHEQNFSLVGVRCFFELVLDSAGLDWSSTEGFASVGLSHPVGHSGSELSHIVFLSIDDGLEIEFLLLELAQPLVHGLSLLFELIVGKMVDVEWLSSLGQGLSLLFSVGLPSVIAVSVSVGSATGAAHGGNSSLLSLLLIALFGLLLELSSRLLLSLSLQSLLLALLSNSHLLGALLLSLVDSALELLEFGIVLLSGLKVFVDQ